MNDQTIADSVVEFVSSQPFPEKWPEYQQLLLSHLLGEPAWNLALPVLCCQAAGGEAHDALPVAAAWSTLHYSALVFDSLQDGHELASVLGSAANAINIATALMFSAYRFLDSIPKADAAQRATLIFSLAGFQSALGQHHDVSRAGRGRAGSEALENYWQMVMYKSGSIFEAAAGGGAAVGTSSSEAINGARTFGNALGVMLQIIDDCRDILPASQEGAPAGDERTLPLLLLQAACEKKGKILSAGQVPDDRRVLFAQLQNENSPQVIVSMLQEWRRRALDGLAILEESEAKSRLEELLDVVWESNYTMVEAKEAE